MREDYLYKERGSGREKAFSSYLSRDINLCWTNWPCCEDNVTAGVSAETEKNQSKVKEKKHITVLIFTKRRVKTLNHVRKTGDGTYL